MEALNLFVQHFIIQYGYLGIFSLTSLEQFIFPIPVDIFFGFSIENGLSYKKLMIIVFIATIFGATIGYYLGKYLGHPALEWMVGKTKVEKGEKFIKKWGILGVILAGMTPIPFKVVTWTAGVFEMPFKRFILGVVIGRMPRYMLTAYAGAKFFETKFYASENMGAIILGLLQGFTEFLPISSSGHLLITEHFLDIPESNIFNIFLHGGSLIAIIIFFWKDWIKVLKELWAMLKKRKVNTDSLSFKLMLATIPAIIAGLTLGDFIDHYMKDIKYIAVSFILIGLLYFYAAWKGKHNHYKSIGLKKSIWIGIAQSIALLPGISRAGMTISSGVILGIKREEAAKFSFMLGGIAILAANVYAIISLKNATFIPDLNFILLGIGTSFISSILAIFLLLKIT